MGTARDMYKTSPTLNLVLKDCIRVSWLYVILTLSDINSLLLKDLMIYKKLFSIYSTWSNVTLLILKVTKNTCETFPCMSFNTGFAGGNGGTFGNGENGG